MMRDKWPGSSSTWNHLHHRGFYFHISGLFQVISHEINHTGPDREGFSGFLIGNQIQVSLAITGLLIGQSMKFFRQRTQ